jgi:hypothetical protein
MLYVALYRDKIAEQQANLESLRSKDEAKSRPERRRRPQALLGAEFGEHQHLVGCASNDRLFSYEEAAGGDASVSVCGQEATAAADALAASSSKTGAGLSRDASRLTERRHVRSLRGNSQTIGDDGDTGSARHGVALGSGDAQERTKKTTHVASVASALGAGGVASEYMESKRLGKLFDEWKLEHADDVEDGSQSQSTRHMMARFVDDSHSGRGIKVSPPGVSPSAASTSSALASPKAKSPLAASERKTPVGGKGRSRAAQQDSATSDTRTGIGLKTPRRPIGELQRLSSDDAKADDDRHGSNEPGMLGMDDAEFAATTDGDGTMSGRRGESKLVSRLFSVVTNPKVVGDAIENSDSARKVPSYVEGFPTLNLMRLYRGPWRLEF